MQRQTFSNSNFTSSRISLEQSITELFDKYNIEVHNKGVDELNIYCPFHKNVHSPAFYINVKTGLWQCFNPSCGRKGNFRQLYREVTGKAFSKDIKLDPIALSNELERSLKYGDKEQDDSLDISAIEIDYGNEQDKELLLTFYERGLEYDTMKYFEIGFSQAKNRIVVPVRDNQYKLVGFIGRAIDSNQEPRYLYNTGFRRANVLFNIQNAKKYDSCIVVEGSVDAMFIHQAGYPNVVATLGSKVSEYQYNLLRKYFDSIIVFSDNDDAGRQMCSDILEACRGKELYTVTLPEDRKDAGEMTKQQIITTLTNKKLHI